ncbi:MAG: TauD/TfdA family dioxygenase [Alphaproteobacteria bacterium]
MTFSIQPLSGPLGAEVSGLNLSQSLDDATIGEILDAWHAHELLLFRGQDISEDQQVGFAARFGNVAPWSLCEDAVETEGASHHPLIMLISNIKKDGEYIGSIPDGEVDFHSDGIYTETPQTATMLYAIEVPSSGGDTLFANMYMAYEALPGDIKERLQGKTALHAFTYNTQTVRDVERKKAEGDAEVSRFSHPVFRTHPATGRKALYVNRLMTQEIEGIGPEEGRRLLDFLFDHSERREFIYAHKWQPRDLLIWDNRCLNHGRDEFDSTERRLMRRLTIAGEKPF